MMSLSNPERYGLIFWALFIISMGFLANLPESFAEQEPQELSKSQVVTRMFQIRNLDIDEAKEKIEELLTKDEKIEASVEVFTFLRAGEEVKFLVVKARPQKIEEIGQVIEELEKQFAPITVNLNFSNAPLNQILATIAQTTGLDIIGGEALSERISLHLKDVPLEDVFDTILKSTGYTYIKEGKILRIFSQEEAPLVTEVFELEFVSARQIEEAVSHLVTERGSVKSFSRFSERQYRGGLRPSSRLSQGQFSTGLRPSSTFSQGQFSTGLGASSRLSQGQYWQYSNVLIVTDTPEALKAIRELVKKLDKKVRQVMIEVKFAEVTLDKDNELGIEWVIQPSISGAKIPTQFPTTTMGIRKLERPAVIDETSGSITLGTISFADFTATLHALDTETKVSLIASPRLATRDGEEAQIVIGDKVPIPLYERNAETGTIEITGYQDEEIGVLLRVTPLINSDNTVTLRIHPEVSEITGYTGPNNERPIVSTREITTIFTVEDGKTIVLGGLMKQTLSNTLKRVPLLGSIPLFGNLFRYQDDSEDKKELLIFITPHILDSSEDIQKEAELKNNEKRDESRKQQRP